VAISVFDLFSIGIGPSSSHTVGPMRAAARFGALLKKDGLLAQTTAVRAELFGSLGATGHGHGTPKAVLLGLEGNEPHTVDVAQADRDVERIRGTGRIRLLGAEIGPAHEIDFDVANQLVLHRRRSLPYHANGMILFAYDADGVPLLEKTYHSLGGGFVVDEDAVGADRIKLADTVLAHPFRTGDELLRLSRETGLSISALMLENEKSWRTEEEIRAGLLEIWRVMEACVSRGLGREGILPGGLKVRRRAAAVARALRSEGDPAGRAMELVTLYAMAVNEENAAGGRVVTAPTNGAAGIIASPSTSSSAEAADGEGKGAAARARRHVPPRRHRPAGTAHRPVQPSRCPPSPLSRVPSAAPATAPGSPRTATCAPAGRKRCGPRRSRFGPTAWR
jgi:L-serine dehydratase